MSIGDATSWPDQTPSGDSVPTTPAPAPPTLHERLLAGFEVTLCSGFPTQIALVVLLTWVGVAPRNGVLSLGYIVTLSLADAGLVIGLIWGLLRVRGEHPSSMFLGVRPIGREATLGLLLVPAALLLVAVTYSVLQQLAPWLHNVPENPLEALIDSPTGAAAFALVAVVAGGLREEVQRAFVLRRFETHLGGPIVGLVLFSVAFGLGHLVQGRDAAIITGLLGAFWGIMYLKRRSIVGPVFCHAGFNLTEVLIAYNVATG